MLNDINIHEVTSYFEASLKDAPFSLDITKDQSGRYVNEYTIKVFASYVSGYFDGYYDVETIGHITQ